MGVQELSILLLMIVPASLISLFGGQEAYLPKPGVKGDLLKEEPMSSSGLATNLGCEMIWLQVSGSPGMKSSQLPSNHGSGGLGGKGLRLRGARGWSCRQV